MCVITLKKAEYFKKATWAKTFTNDGVYVYKLSLTFVFVKGKVKAKSQNERGKSM